MGRTRDKQKEGKNVFDTLSAQMMGDWTSKSTLWSLWWCEDSRRHGVLFLWYAAQTVNATELNPPTTPQENHYWQAASAYFTAQPHQIYNYLSFFHYTPIFLLSLDVYLSTIGCLSEHMTNLPEFNLHLNILEWYTTLESSSHWRHPLDYKLPWVSFCWVWILTDNLSYKLTRHSFFLRDLRLAKFKGSTAYRLYHSKVNKKKCI